MPHHVIRCVRETEGSSDVEFPVRRIYCIGLNYVEHVREMGFDQQPPLFFAKPGDAVVYVPDGLTGSVSYPAQTSDYQYEIALVVAIGKAGSDIAVADARSHIFGYAIGLDMTRRDLQARARELGLPRKPASPSMRQPQSGRSTSPLMQAVRPQAPFGSM